MPADEHTTTLVALSDTMRTVADPQADVRGRRVLDRDGEDIGRVDDLLVDDDDAATVRFLRVGAGGFLGIGEQHFLVPVDAVAEIDRDAVHVDRERARFDDVPVYDPELADLEPEYYASTSGWWGVAPYGTLGYTYPGFPPRGRDTRGR